MRKERTSSLVSRFGWRLIGICVVLSLIAGLFQVSAGTPAQAASGKASTLDAIWRELLVAKSQTSPGNKFASISLNEALVNRYLNQIPRNYSAIVYFTLDDPRCQACQLVDPVFSEASKAWSMTRGTRNVFFFHFLLKTANDPVAAKLGIRNAPIIIHLGPSDTAAARVLSQDDVYKLTMQTLQPSLVLEWVAQRTGVVMHPFVNPWPRLIASVLVASVLAGLIVGLVKVIPVLFSSWNDPLVWYAIALVPFFATIAGVVWDAIRQPMLFSQNPQTGKLMFIAPSGQYQFILEGIIISILTIAIGVLIVIITTNLEELTAWKQRLFFYPTATLLFLLMWTLHNFFCIKHKYYPFAGGQQINRFLGLI